MPNPYCNKPVGRYFCERERGHEGDCDPNAPQHNDGERCPGRPVLRDGRFWWPCCDGVTDSAIEHPQHNDGERYWDESAMKQPTRFCPWCNCQTIGPWHACVEQRGDGPKPVWRRGVTDETSRALPKEDKR